MEANRSILGESWRPRPGPFDARAARGARKSTRAQPEYIELNKGGRALLRTETNEQ